MNEELTCEREFDNPHDRNAVKVVKGTEIVRHVPRNYSRVFTYVLFAGGNVTSIVTGSRQNQRNNGLEVPCKHRLKGTKHSISNAECIIRDMLSRSN